MMATAKATAPRKPRRWLEYMPLDDLVRAKRNPKDHDEDAIGLSITEFGFMEPALMDERTGRLIGGHGRLDNLAAKKDAGEKPPDGIVLDKSKRWLMPVTRGWHSRDDKHAEAALIALNRIGEKGGWLVDPLYAMLDELSDNPDLLLATGYEPPDLDDLLASKQEREIAFNAVEHYSGLEGAHAERSFEDRARKYAGKGTRALILDYTLDDFDVLAAGLGRLRRAFDYETNAQAVSALVKEKVATLPDEP